MPHGLGGRGQLLHGSGPSDENHWDGDDSLTVDEVISWVAQAVQDGWL